MSMNFTYFFKKGRVFIWGSSGSRSIDVWPASRLWADCLWAVRRTVRTHMPRPCRRCSNHAPRKAEAVAPASPTRRLWADWRLFRTQTGFSRASPLASEMSRLRRDLYAVTTHTPGRNRDLYAVTRHTPRRRRDLPVNTYQTCWRQVGQTHTKQRPT